jgi:hypothetical protein
MRKKMTVKDSIKTEKVLRPSDEISQSLIHLRDELWARRKENVVASEILAKINTCLYSGYQLKTEFRMDQEWSAEVNDSFSTPNRRKSR